MKEGSRVETYLHPTIWRTCRVLANLRRLRCLRAVLESPGLTVGEIAGNARLSFPETSRALRALQARGLLTAHRQGKWVSYMPTVDPSVPSAQNILAAVTLAFAGKYTSQDVFRDVTAFTHPRRVSIVCQLLCSGPLHIQRLAALCDISLPAIYRHVDKLISRKVILDDDSEVVSLLPAQSPIIRAVFELIKKS